MKRQSFRRGDTPRLATTSAVATTGSDLQWWIPIVTLDLDRHANSAAASRRTPRPNPTVVTIPFRREAYRPPGSPTSHELRTLWVFTSRGSRRQSRGELTLHLSGEAVDQASRPREKLQIAAEARNRPNASHQRDRGTLTTTSVTRLRRCKLSSRSAQFLSRPSWNKQLMMLIHLVVSECQGLCLFEEKRWCSRFVISQGLGRETHCENARSFQLPRP